MKNLSVGNEFSTSGVTIMEIMPRVSSSICHAMPDSRTSWEKPGYQLCHYVEDFIKTDAGLVPRIKTHMETADHIANMLVRCGVNRYRYKVAAGLYAVGHPDSESEVLVTASFKLTFDHLRRQLSGVNAWILVLDTRGINVWCAAGKGTFSTENLVHQLEETQLARVVNHRRIIVPQLGATGVSATAVKKQSGFKVVYGPVRASDIQEFMSNGLVADETMRTVTFSLSERLILTPIELQTALKPALITALIIFLLSGIGPQIFSVTDAWKRGVIAVFALAAGMLAGAVITPALLPFIPVKEFALKGIITGFAGALLVVSVFLSSTVSLAAGFALLILITTVSSVMAMNYTGTTPFTSPSGVEKEMKRYIPVQFIGLVLSAGIWVYSAF